MAEVTFKRTTSLCRIPWHWIPVLRIMNAIEFVAVKYKGFVIPELL